MRLRRATATSSLHETITVRQFYRAAILFGVVIVALNSSCGSPGSGDRFTFRLGISVTIEGEGFRLAYDSVRDE